MKVRILTHIIGTPAYCEGDVVELEERIAKAWIAEGIASPARPGEKTGARRPDDRVVQ